jgi:hypothetical protein
MESAGWHADIVCGRNDGRVDEYIQGALVGKAQLFFD